MDQVRPQAEVHPAIAVLLPVRVTVLRPEAVRHQVAIAAEAVHPEAVVPGAAQVAVPVVVAVQATDDKSGQLKIH